MVNTKLFVLMKQYGAKEGSNKSELILGVRAIMAMSCVKEGGEQETCKERIYFIVRKIQSFHTYRSYIKLNPSVFERYFAKISVSDRA